MDVGIWEVCADCRGDGYYFQEQNVPPYQYRVTCETCQGIGEVEVIVEDSELEALEQLVEPDERYN